MLLKNLNHSNKKILNYKTSTAIIHNTDLRESLPTNATIRYSRVIVKAQLG